MMSRARACLSLVAATVVMVVAMTRGCDGLGERPSLDGLLQAREVEEQLDLIDSLLKKLRDGSSCPNVSKEKDAAEGTKESITEEKAEEEKEKEEKEEEEETFGAAVGQIGEREGVEDTEEKKEEEVEEEEVEKEEKEPEEETDEMKEKEEDMEEKEEEVEAEADTDEMKEKEDMEETEEEEAEAEGDTDEVKEKEEDMEEEKEPEEETDEMKEKEEDMEEEEEVEAEGETDEMKEKEEDMKEEVEAEEETDEMKEKEDMEKEEEVEAEADTDEMKEKEDMEGTEEEEVEAEGDTDEMKENEEDMKEEVEAEEETDEMKEKEEDMEKKEEEVEAEGDTDGKPPEEPEKEEEEDPGEVEQAEEEEEEETEEEKKIAYAKLTETHTMLLPPNEECNLLRTGISDEDKDVILSLHNELRNKVAQGNEEQGAPGPQPSAADMHQLIWNDELAEVAQAWATQCPYGHDGERSRRLLSRKYRTGQNINYLWSQTPEGGSQWEKAIGNWYSEVADVDAEVAKSFKPHETKKIGHYTQLVWGKTKEIGCGIVYYQVVRHGINYTDSITHVCNYGPAGNILKRPFYEHGPGASSCLDSPSEDFPALCL